MTAQGHNALENPTTILPKWNGLIISGTRRHQGRLPRGGGRTEVLERWSGREEGGRRRGLWHKQAGWPLSHVTGANHTHVSQLEQGSVWRSGGKARMRWGEVWHDPAGQTPPKLSPLKTFCSAFSKDPISRRLALLNTPPLLNSNPHVFSQYNQCRFGWDYIGKRKKKILLNISL